ncbi:MAG: acetylglutamate kinase [Deltaproteobacteria bacterium]|nr:acetylglutamate kinase [Deltaproteobacteria bacterium]NIS76392.1 acetylglutamate kinase [Deltaproteobacteria bacterium]
MEKEMKRAEILIEALPYIREFWGKTIVIKYGGAAMAEEELKSSFSDDVVLLRYIGLLPVIVHGGGPQIASTLKKMGKDTIFVRGMRVTDDETMDVVEMVLVGKVNKEIVALINSSGGIAAGLSGKDGNLLQARKYVIEPEKGDLVTPEMVDIGKVGIVERVNPRILSVLMEKGFIPVIAPVGVGEKGETLNINADFVAASIAKSLKAEKLILLTDVEGVQSGEGLISSLDVASAGRLIKEGGVSGGMIPKVECAIDALNGGVGKVHIIDGRIKHSVLLEIFTSRGIGTEVVPVA